MAVAAVGALISICQPATADAATYVYTGKLGSGVDGQGLFGVAGGSLGGVDFTATFVRQDAWALPEDIVFNGTDSGISGNGVHSPVTATLTINGHTVAIGGGSGEQLQFDNGVGESFSIEATSQTSRIQLGAFLPEGVERPIDLGPDYHGLVSLTYQGVPGFQWFGDFLFFDPDPNGDVETRGLFDGSTLRLSVDGTGDLPLAGVPEPAGWALMIVGAGLAGATLRRRRAAVAV